MKKGMMILLGILMTAQLAMAEEVKLIMWQHESDMDESNFYVSRIEKFNQMNAGKISVELKFIPRGGGYAYEEKLNMGAAAGDLPDVIDMDGPYVANYAYSKILRPLDDMIDKDGEWFKDLVPATIAQGTYDGKLYAFGAMESSVGIFFNKKIMAQIGVEPPTSVEKAWTFDEFVAVLEKLKQALPADVYPITNLSGPNVDEWQTYMGAPFVWSNGGDLISPDGRQAEGYLNSPETIEAFTKIQELYTKGYTVNDPGEREFQREKSAMRISGPWEVKSLREYPDLEWGITPYPVFKTPSSPTGSWCWGVSMASEHPAEALEVIKWLTGKESTLGLTNLIGMLPTAKSAYAELTQFNTPPFSVFMEQQLNGAHPRPQTPAYPVLTTEFAQAWHDVMVGKDAKEALDAAAKKVDSYIKRRMK